MVRDGVQSLDNGYSDREILMANWRIFDSAISLCKIFMSQGKSC
jgi:hypothetical protein